MKSEKRYLRNKIVYNFFTDIRNTINKHFFYITCLTIENENENKNKKL
jgi:hypothetical protein